MPVLYEPCFRMVQYSPSRTLVEMYKKAYVHVNIRLVEKSNGDPEFQESRMEQSFTIKIHFTALVLFFKLKNFLK